MYGKNRVNNEINNISADKEKDANGYVNEYINIVNDKIYFVNDVSELIDELLGSIDENTSNDIALQKLKNFKNYMLKSINNFNSYIKTDKKNHTKPDTKNNAKKKDTKKNTKPDTKNNSEPHTENNIEPDSENNIKKKDTENDTKNNSESDTEDDIEWDINDTRASIRKNQITIKNRYKSLLETKKTIRNNIDSVYSGLKKLPRESQLKANELFKLDTILNDSINVIWREINDRDKKL